ncbi:DUF1697 domain-containing protein [Euzebya tangerina]|uniref:DUF1697 domain-containing protein n=1 Tax=Euzebya tangerina TaxID=591198 RepID=UPI000E312C8B|nr:DUF1697 domain-containing protein [Euzebya tangerina]
MTTWVAFLRALNVGGRRLTNQQLAEAVGACGMRDVRTFLASGNVVFGSDVRDEEDVVAALEEGLEGSLGYEVPAFVRPAAEVRELSAATPFQGRGGSPEGKPQVMFLTSPIREDHHDRLAELTPAGELLVPDGRHLHWLPQSGISTSSLDLTALDAIIGPCTVRTRNTVVRLAGKYLS